MRYFISVLTLLVLSSGYVAQNDTIKLRTKKGGSIYLSAGFTRVWHGKSDIRFTDQSNKYHDATGKNNYYDFTVYGVTAHDRPDFDKIPDVVNFTVPQFAYRLGYYFNNKSDLGVEINYDHTKYIVDDYQRVRVKGHFNGQYVDKDTTLTPNDFLHFEHSDGANFLLFNFMKRFKFFERSDKINIGWVTKAGLGMVIPRTDVTLFGERLNNDFHIAGWMAGVETGLRTEFLRHAFFEFVAKGNYADYVNVLVLGKGNGKASHHFFSYQLTAQLGVVVGLKKK